MVRSYLTHCFTKCSLKLHTVNEKLFYIYEKKNESEIPFEFFEYSVHSGFVVPSEPPTFCKDHQLIPIMVI